MNLKNVLFVFVIFSSIFIVVENSNALETYVGIKINNLTDDPAAGCIGKTGTNGGGAFDYGPNGKIRAISSVLPNYPIYFEVTRDIDDTVIFAKNSTEDTDYIIGETIWLPGKIDIELGKTYRLMFDIDAIRVYLPLYNLQSFVPTETDNYWTAGELVGAYEYYFYDFFQNHCVGATTDKTTSNPGSVIMVAVNRTKLGHSCISGGMYDCDENGVIGSNMGYSYNYLGLHNSTVGNFKMSFQLI